MPPTTLPPAKALAAVFEADRQLRQAEADLLAAPSAVVEDLLAAAVQQAKAMSDRSEAVMRLERLADLCAQVPGPRMADALIAILDDGEASARVAAGEAILDVAYERYAEVARAIERRLQSQAEGPALSELPWILAEVGEPSALGLLQRFLQHADAEVVAAALEALVRLGDPQAIEIIAPLCDDERQTRVDDLENATFTLGELASDAIEELSGEQAAGGRA